MSNLPLENGIPRVFQQLRYIPVILIWAVIYGVVFLC